MYRIPALVYQIVALEISTGENSETNRIVGKTGSPW